MLWYSFTQFLLILIRQVYTRWQVVRGQSANVIPRKLVEFLSWKETMSTDNTGKYYSVVYIANKRMITLVDFVRDSEVKTQYVTEDLTVGPGLQ